MMAVVVSLVAEKVQGMRPNGVRQEHRLSCATCGLQLANHSRQGHRGLFAMDIQVPGTNARLHPFARTFFCGSTYESQGSTYQFCERRLDPILGRGLQEGVYQRMLGAHGAFHNPQEHFVKKHRMIGIRLTGERTIHGVMCRTPVGVYYFFTDPVVAHGGSPVRSTKKRTHILQHFRAIQHISQKARPAWVIDVEAGYTEGIAFLALHSEREYHTTRSPKELPLATHASERIASAGL